MKQTPFAAYHEKLGARMVEFAGFYMPVFYQSINAEHLNVRSNVGVFDVSHMGEFLVEGEGARDLVQYLTTNDVDRLVTGQAQYTCFPNENGGIVDDLLVYKLSEEKYMLVVNAANIAKDWEWVNRHNRFSARTQNISNHTAQLAVQGPNALKVLQKITPVPLDQIAYYHFTTGALAGVDGVLISATGYTGAGGFEIYFDQAHAGAIWESIFDAGKEYDIMPAGLGARDTLRLEMGFCLYGNDIDDTTSPLEAGLGWITRLKAENNQFINRDYFIRQKEEGLKKKLAGFELTERGIPRHGYRILNPAGEVIGRVTSGTQSPSLNKAIGMGYIPLEYAAPGSEIHIEIRNKPIAARVVRLPFYKPD